MSFFVHTTAAPAYKTPDVKRITLLYGGILLVLALCQLFSFDDFLNLLESFWLPGGRPLSNLLAGLLVTTEIFALPFLLRMRLSPLARVLSMVLGWLVPLLWCGIALWLVLTVNAVTNIGFLGTVAKLTPGWWAVFISLALGLLAAWSSWGLWPIVRRTKK